MTASDPNATPDPIVAAALTWLKEQAEPNRGINGDLSIHIYRMVLQFKLTMAQYWATLEQGIELTSGPMQPVWLSLAVLKNLSDWTYDGESLHRLVRTFPASLQEERWWPRELRENVSWLGPQVTWTPDSFRSWVMDPGILLTCWTEELVRKLPFELLPHLWTSYLQQKVAHNTLDLGTVRFIVDSFQGRPVTALNDITVFMSHPGYCVGQDLPQTYVVQDAWFNTLVWTSDTVAANMQALRSAIPTDNYLAWARLAPRIGEALSFIVEDPESIDAAITILSKDSVRNNGALSEAVVRGLILSGVKHALPDEYVQDMVRHGDLMLCLSNRAYPSEQRLSWLRNNAEKLTESTTLSQILPTLDSPLKAAVALFCVMRATKKGAGKTVWKALGVGISSAVQARFLKAFAPALRPHMELVRSLGLTYSDALEMYLTGAGYRGVEVTPSALPELGNTL
jgi:hypothetical protein